MSKLFIIGNGFDLFHGLSTRFIDYKNYLCEHYPDNVLEFQDRFSHLITNND